MQKGDNTMNYEIRKGTADNTIILLHGTGGDAQSLMDLGAMLDSQATRVGIQGNVIENNMRRYFERYFDGSFNLKSLAKETYELKETLDAIVEKHDLDPQKVVIVGYSNGANIAINLMKEFEMPYAAYILFHPSVVRQDIAFKPQRGKAFLTYGKNDPFLNEDGFDTMVSMLRKAKIETDIVKHDYGHSLTEEEVRYASKLV